MKYSLTAKLPDRLPMTPPDDAPEPDLSDALPCPQCGYEPIAKRQSGAFIVLCDQRHLEGLWCRSLEKAIEYWNSAVEERKGENLKAEGVAQVSENNEAWMEAVLESIGRFAKSGIEFTAEDVRTFCGTWASFHPPTSPNAWGAAFSVAAKQGLIVRTGYTKNALPSAHARVVAVWKGANVTIEQI